MKIKFILVALLAVAAAVGVAEHAGFPKIRFTAHVIGEDGAPISDASATFIFNVAPVGAEQTADVKEITDSNGNFIAEGYSQTGVLNWRKGLNKEGYYESTLPITPFYTSKDGHWQPWDQAYTTVMRRVGTPIPIYVRKLAIKIPGSINEPCGFDLEEADWVAPYGKGKVADFLITTTNARYGSFSDYDATATVTFPNNGDGIQEIQLPKEFANSVFKWPREAPEDGYQPKLETHRMWMNTQTGNTQSVNTANENQAYFFRVRTIKKGEQIVSALYGKIAGGLTIGPDKTQHGFIQFTYYLNPTPLDRNLEFSGDTLFKNLPDSETTHVP